MKICMIAWEFPPKICGGLGVHVYENSKKLVENGNEVHVITMKSEGLPSREIMNGIDVLRIDYPDLRWIDRVLFPSDTQKLGMFEAFFTNTISFNVFAFSAYKQLEKEGYEIDIVHAHDWLGIPAAMVLQKEFNIPFVLTMHSTEYGRSGGGGLSVIHNLEVLGGQKADRVITVSNSMKEELVSIGFEREKIDVVYNGVDESKYNPRNSGVKIKEKFGIKGPLILFVGRLVWRKGVEYLIRAMPKIISIEPDAELIILGVGSEEEKLMKLARDMRMENKITFINRYVSEKERIQFYAAADVVCVPSTYEPFGIVAVEGMSSGKPVVASRTGGLMEIINDGESGLLANPGDAEDLANKITSILKDKELAKKLSVGGRKRIEQEFTWKKIAEKTLSIYEKVLYGL